MDAMLRETHAAEQRHFWYRGFRCFMRPILAAATRGERPRRLLDLTLSGLVRGRGYGARRVACADACRMPFPAAAFDVVTSFDVLYCLDDAEERAAIDEIFRVLRPGGHALVSVPAFDALRGDHSVFVHERRRYTRGRLYDALERAGFRIQRLLAIRSWQRARGLSRPGEARSDFRQPPAIVDALLGALLAAEARIVRLIDLPLGSTVVCVARKPQPEPPADA